MKSINSKKDYHKPMTLYEFKLDREISHRDTFSKSKTEKLYQRYLKKYERQIK